MVRRYPYGIGFSTTTKAESGDSHQYADAFAKMIRTSPSTVAGNPANCHLEALQATGWQSKHGIGHGIRKRW